MSTLRASRPVAVLLLFVLWPSLGLAQSAPPAGIVTQLQGKASIARPVVTQPIPLKFKDDVFFRDQVSTGDFDVPEVIVKGSDEVAMLSGSFNRMRISLTKALKMLEGE